MLEIGCKRLADWTTALLTCMHNPYSGTGLLLQVRQALRFCQGDVDQAATFIMEQRQKAQVKSVSNH